MKIQEITRFLEAYAPLSLQESYDNCGLLIGDSSDEVSGALITLDVTEDVLDEAIRTGHDLIIAHHPFIFSGIKKIGKRHWIDKCIRKAIKHDIAIYAIHTNLDNIQSGVNDEISRRLGLNDCRILAPKEGLLQKLVVYVPADHKQVVLQALFNAGAGSLGNYDECSFQLSGIGTFKGNSESNPTLGTIGEREEVEETRLEVLIQAHQKDHLIRVLNEHHPYEEVAYDIIPIDNVHATIGPGMIGRLPVPVPAQDFFQHLKKTMGLSFVRHTDIVHERIQTVAVCGGSGSFLLHAAKRARADVLVTSDFKYHDFFEANGEIILADIGHYESEVFTKDLLFRILTKNFTNFAVRLSKVDTNPINYL